MPGIPIREALVSGAIVGAATALTAVVCARRYGIRAAAPLNAVSHVLWGVEAREQRRADLQHTAVGFAINHAASVFWAAIYEAGFGAHAERKNMPKALGGAALIAGLAYVVDYYVVPKRLTPGYELVLPRRALAAIYAVLAAALPLRGLLQRHVHRAALMRRLRNAF